MPDNRTASASAAPSSSEQYRSSSLARSHFPLDQVRFVDEEHDKAGPDGADSNDGDAAHQIESIYVYPILQLILKDIRSTIDTGLTWEELTDHELNFAIVRPLARKYCKLHSKAILYSLLVTRIHFLREADRDLANQNISHIRADLCELLAIKLLRTFASSGMNLVTALGSPLWPFSGAPPAVLENAKRLGYAQKDPFLEATSALQLAVFSSAKKFVATPLVQKCIDGIWMGQVVLGNSSTTGHAIIEDSYKKRPVSIYNPARAPFLDHRRLRVPRVRAFLEAANFTAILFAYINCLRSEGSSHWTTSETIFIIWLVGLAIDELAQIQEHGWSVYASSLFNILDGLFCAIGFAWFGTRISGLLMGSLLRSNFAFNILSLGAILLCPRVASLLISDNVLLLALRAMVVEFSYFLGVALVFFAGFLWTFWSLSDSQKWTPVTIGWLMLRFTFGNTISFEEAQEFSPTFGPWLVVAFTILAQTLLLTILISLLSATFARVAEHAQEESLFQHAYSTLQGVSSEALFSYVPPLNILCILIVLPASFVLTPRWIHKLNVFVIRATHFPILLCIRLVERGDYWTRGIELLSHQGASPDGSSSITQAVQYIIGRWTRNKRRTQVDLIEVVFSNLLDHEQDNEPDVGTGQDDSGPRGGGTLQRQKAIKKCGEDGIDSSAVSPSERVMPTTESPRVIAARSRHSRNLNRMSTTESTIDALPKSPGATIRRMKAACAASSQRNSVASRDQQALLAYRVSDRSELATSSGVTGLSRHDTFASLFTPRTGRRGNRAGPRRTRGRGKERKAAKTPSGGAHADTARPVLQVPFDPDRSANDDQQLELQYAQTMMPVAEDDHPEDVKNVVGYTEGLIEKGRGIGTVLQQGKAVRPEEDEQQDASPDKVLSQTRSRSSSQSQSRSQFHGRLSRSLSHQSSASRSFSASEGEADASFPEEDPEAPSERFLEEVMLGFVDRLDEQTAANERIEVMLTEILEFRRREALLQQLRIEESH